MLPGLIAALTPPAWEDITHCGDALRQTTSNLITL